MPAFVRWPAMRSAVDELIAWRSDAEQRLRLHVISPALDRYAGDCSTDNQC
jgi:hypothetical protein